MEKGSEYHNTCEHKPLGPGNLLKDMNRFVWETLF